ncbi:MAG: Wzz/FepE/Etk N-terminal domain-containing protein [Bacillota bacterium]
MSEQKEPVFIEETIDLREYFRVLAKWKKLIALGTLLAVLTSAVLSFFVLPPVYEAKILLLVTQAATQQRVTSQGQGLEEVVGALSRLPQMTMNTYLGQVKSETLMQRVINNLGLDPALYTPVSLASQIQASVQKDANLIEVKVRNGDPRLAARIANTLAQEYLKLISEKNQEQMARSVDFLQKQKEAAAKDLEKAIAALKKFEEQPRGVAVLEEEFKGKTAELSAYRAQLNAAEVQMRQLAAGVDRLESELVGIPATVQVEKADPETGRTYTLQDTNPVYVSVSEQLNQKRAALAEKEAETAALHELVDRLEIEAEQIRGELVGKKAKFEALQDEVTRLKETTSLLAQKTTETQIARSMDLGQTSVVVVSEAGIPSAPVKPNKKLNIAVAFVLGLMVFTGLAFILEHLDNTFKSADDVARQLGLPVLGVIPDGRRDRRSAYGA